MQKSGYSLSILQHIGKFGLTVPPFREGSPEEAWLLCTNPRVCILGKENNVGGKHRYRQQHGGPVGTPAS